MKLNCAGSSMVEFVFVFPMFFFVTLILFHAGALFLQKLQLSRLAFDGGRWLAHYPVQENSDFLDLLNSWLSVHSANPPEADVQLEEIPSVNSSPLRNPKKIYLLHVTLKRKWRGFWVKGHSEFVRVSGGPS